MEKQEDWKRPLTIMEPLVPEERINEIAENAKEILNKEFERAFNEYTDGELAKFSSNELIKFLDACLLDAAFMEQAIVKNINVSMDEKETPVKGLFSGSFCGRSSALIFKYGLGKICSEPYAEIYLLSSLKQLPLASYVIERVLPQEAYAIVNVLGHYSLVTREEESILVGGQGKDSDDDKSRKLLLKIRSRNDNDFLIRAFKPEPADKEEVKDQPAPKCSFLSEKKDEVIHGSSTGNVIVEEFKHSDEKDEEENIDVPGVGVCKVQVSKNVKELLPESVHDMVTKVIEKPDSDDKSLVEESNKVLEVLRGMKGNDPYDKPAEKLKKALAEVITDVHDTHSDAPAPEKDVDLDQSWKEKKFKEYTDNMFRIFRAKNQDYTASNSIGSAFDITYDLFGPIAPAVRFVDKVLRYVSLSSGKEQMVADEKVEDTLTDLANYALLTLLKREGDKRNDQQHR